MSLQINKNPILFRSVDSEFKRSNSYSDIINSLVDKSKRLLIPTNSFMNFYFTSSLPKYELKRFEFKENSLSDFNNVNFSIKDRFELLVNPIRVFIKDNSMYIGHLPDNYEVTTEIFIFLSIYLNRLSNMIESIKTNEYFSWDKNKMYKPVVGIDLLSRSSRLTIDNNLVKFLPPNVITKGIYESKDISKFIFICGSDSLIQYLNEETN